MNSTTVGAYQSYAFTAVVRTAATKGDERITLFLLIDGKSVRYILIRRVRYCFIIMLIVAFSRGLAIPKYLKQLEAINWDSGLIASMSQVSFGLMCFALGVGAYIILKGMIVGRRKEREMEMGAGSNA